MLQSSRENIPTLDRMLDRGTIVYTRSIQYLLCYNCLNTKHSISAVLPTQAHFSYSGVKFKTPIQILFAVIEVVCPDETMALDCLGAVGGERRKNRKLVPVLLLSTPEYHTWYTRMGDQVV